MATPSLHAAIIEYLDALHAAGVPQGTRKQYRSMLFRLHRAYPTRLYGSITTRDLAVFLYGPHGTAVGLAPATGTSQRAALRSFFAWGQQMIRGAKPVEVPSPVIRQRVPRPDARPTRLPAQTLVQLLESCDPDEPREIVLRAVLAVSINTAWRISDAVKPRVRDIGLVTGDLWFVSRKTGKPDSFPITLDLDEELRRYLSWYTAATGTTLDDQDAYLFPGWQQHSQGPDGGFTFEPATHRHASEEWARNGLKRLFTRCGVHVEKGEAWHTIRRSVARIYFDSLRHDISYDHALKQTAALLQHDSVVTTEKYLGLDAEVQARNASLKGKPFIGIRNTNVVQLKRQAH